MIARPDAVISRRRVVVRAITSQVDRIAAVLGNGGTIARRFDGYNERPEQMSLSRLIADAIEAREHVAGEAGTGVGKSFAYLIPAIQSGKRTVVAVPTIALQEQLIGKDLPFLSQPGILDRPFRYALLKGRRNYVCRLKFESMQAEPIFERREDAAVWPVLTDWYRETTDGDLGKLSMPLPMVVRNDITADSEECLGDACPKYTTCFGEIAKARAQEADVIVTNYALLMLDLKLRAESGGMISLLPDGIQTLILDECHQLREKAVNAFTIEVTLQRFERIQKRIISIARKGQALARQDYMMRVAEELAAAADEEREPREIPEPDLENRWKTLTAGPWTELLWMFRDYGKRFEDETVFRLGDETEAAHDPLMALSFVHVRMIEGQPNLLETDRVAWEKARDSLAEYISDLVSVVKPANNLESVRFASKDGDGDDAKVTLSWSPVDVSPFLRDRMWNASLIRPKYDDNGILTSILTPLTVVSVSATIAEAHSGLSFYRETVGLDTAREMVVGSPFDYRRDTLLYLPGFNPIDPSASRKNKDEWSLYLDNLTHECIRLVNASRGRAFILFTARKVMEHVYGEMVKVQHRDSGRLPWRLLKQGDKGQTELVSDFKAEPSVLFGLKSYWEGVDVAGEALSLVIITAIPFTPPSDPVFAARCEAVDWRYGRMASFNKISIPEATLALKQAFGRGKRTETDRAVIAILDGRMLTKPYGKRIADALPPSPVVNDFAQVKAFFS